MLRYNEQWQNESVIAEELFAYVEKCGVSFSCITWDKDNAIFCSFLDEDNKTVFYIHRVMLFIFALPVMQVVLFCLAIGRDPKDLKIAIVNHEMVYGNESCPTTEDCNFSHLSCRYLKFLDEDMITIVRYIYMYIYIIESDFVVLICSY